MDKLILFDSNRVIPDYFHSYSKENTSNCGVLAFLSHMTNADSIIILVVAVVDNHFNIMLAILANKFHIFMNCLKHLWLMLRCRILQHMLELSVSSYGLVDKVKFLHKYSYYIFDELRED